LLQFNQHYDIHLTAKFVAQNSIIQCRCHRREDIAALKCFTNRMPKELFIGQMNRPPIPFPLADPCEYSVVWSDEKLFATFNQKRPALRTYAGIDNRDMNCSVREISVTSEQVESRGRDI